MVPITRGVSRVDNELFVLLIAITFMFILVPFHHSILKGARPAHNGRLNQPSGPLFVPQAQRAKYS
jgi:hypothetical protein